MDPRDLRDLSGKAALITGGSSGMGLAAALLFSRRGASVVIGGRNESRLADAVAQIREVNGGHADRIATVIGDVTLPAVRQELVETTVKKFGKLDILLSNAGGAEMGQKIHSATEELFDHVISVHLKASFFLIQAALPHLQKSKGNILVNSSVASTFVIKDCPIYPMAKAGLDHMVRSLALDLAEDGIRINSINPSYVPTNLMRNVVDNKEQADLIEIFEGANVPLTGECVSKDDVAEYMAFLVSDAAKCITGQNHIIDGARHYMPFIDCKTVEEIKGSA